MDFEPTINYNCDVINNPDGSLTLTGKEDQNTFSSNGVTITLEKGASITIHTLIRKDEKFTVWIDEADTFQRDMLEACMNRGASDVVVIETSGKPFSEDIPYFGSDTYNIALRDQLNEHNVYEQRRRPFEHRKGAFANGGRG